MQRNMDLLLEILSEFQKAEPTLDVVSSPWVKLYVVGFDFKTISYHVQLLNDCGYIRDEALIMSSSNIFARPVVKYRPDVLTMQGHDFAILLTKPDVLEKIKSEFKDAPFDTVRAFVKRLALKWATDHLLDGE